MEELCMVQVGLGNKDWYVITGLHEIKQFCMAEDSLSHLPSQVAARAVRPIALHFCSLRYSIIRRQEYF
jgi:hypothetical protein